MIILPIRFIFSWQQDAICFNNRDKDHVLSVLDPAFYLDIKLQKWFAVTQMWLRYRSLIIIFLFTCRYQSWTAGTSSEGSRCNSRAPGKCQMGFGWNAMLILFETLHLMSRSSQLWQSKHICCVYMTLFNCPNWQPLSLFIGSLHCLTRFRYPDK